MKEVAIAKEFSRRIEETEFFEQFQYIVFSPRTEFGGKGLMFVLKGFEDLILGSEIRVFPPKVKIKKDDKEFEVNIPLHGFVEDSEKRPKVYLNERLFHYTGKDKLGAVGGVLFHEILHFRLRHTRRFEEFLKKNPLLANYALDLFIQEIVTKFIQEPEELVKNSISFDSLNSNAKIVSLDIEVTRNKRSFNINEMKNWDEFELLEFFFNRFEELYKKLSEIIDNQVKAYFIKRGGV